MRSILLQYKSTSLAFFSLDNADSAYGSNANLSSVGSCAAPGLRLKSRESTTRYLKNSRPQYKQEEKKNLLNIIPEEEVSFYNTSIEVPVPDDCRYHEPKKKKGFHEEEHRKTDNMHPATLFEAFFPKQEKAEKMKPEPEHYSCQKSNDIDMTKKMRQDRETVDHSEEKKLNSELVENHVENIIEREEDVPDFRNRPPEQTVKPEKARRRLKVEEDQKVIYHCPFCNRRTRSSEALKKHLEQIHISEIIQESTKEVKPVTPFSPDYRRHLENLPNVFFFTKDNIHYAAFFVEKEMAEEKSEPEAVRDSDSVLPNENGTSSFNTGPITTPIEENSSHEAPLTRESTLTVPVDHDAGEAHHLDVKQLHQGNDTVPVNEAGQAHQDYKKKIHKENLQMESLQACAAEKNRVENSKVMLRSNGTGKTEPEAEVCGPDTEDTVPVNYETGQAHQLDTKQKYKKITNKENLQIETPRAKNLKGSRNAFKQGFEYLKQVMNLL